MKKHLPKNLVKNLRKGGNNVMRICQRVGLSIFSKEGGFHLTYMSHLVWCLNCMSVLNFFKFVNISIHKPPPKQYEYIVLISISYCYFIGTSHILIRRSVSRLGGGDDFTSRFNSAMYNCIYNQRHIQSYVL